MKSRLTLYTLGIVLLVCIALLFVTTNAVRSIAIDGAHEQCENEAMAIARMFEGRTDEEAIETMRIIAGSHAQRIQVIRDDGVIEIDTRTLSGSAQLDLNSNTDITEALAGYTGYRIASEGNTDMMYVSVQYADDLALRVIKPMTSVYRDVNAQMRIVYIWVGLMPVLVLLLLLVINRFTSDHNRDVIEGMKQLQDGNLSYRLKIPQHDPDGIVQHFNDMAEQVDHKSQSARRRNHAMNLVTNTMISGILAVDSEMHIILINPEAKRMLGITGSAEGKPIAEALHDVRLNSAFANAMEHEGINTSDVAIQANAGRTRRPLRMYATALREDDKIVGALALIEDVTELKRLEQVRTDFAANVSHELKTPLTSIKGFVETLQAGAISNPEMAQKFLNIIMLEADRLTRLINDILSISKLESGEDKVELQALILNTMTAETCELLRMHADQKHITINFNENAPTTVIWGNPDRVKQLLINIIDNAVKYTLEGGSVNVNVYKDDSTAYFSCSDTGIGIAEENIPRLFERFYRVDKGRSRSMGGTGLGLAIVKHIVTSMDGHIEVHSKLGEGTEFLISLPLYTGKIDDALVNDKQRKNTAE